MEIRPIDANALFDALYDNEFQTFCPLDEVSDVIAAAPTLDYLPVRHGEWIDEIEPNAVTASGREIHVFRCSACDFTWANKTAVLHYFKHCPNCGAKMDGGKENARSAGGASTTL